MILYFIRHGKPDYETDTLTPEGILQAKAASDRMVKSAPDVIFATCHGRAQETAYYTAQKLGLPINVEQWAKELSEESKTEYPDGIKKSVAHIDPALLIKPSSDGYTAAQSLEKTEAFGDGLRKKYAQISEGIDDLLSRLGYERNENGHYDCTGEKYGKVAFFCHAGLTRMFVSHILNIPYHYLASTGMASYTGITVLHFEAVCDTLPRLLSYGDVGHLHSHGLDAYNTNEEEIKF